MHIEHRTSAICGKKTLSDYKPLVECAFREQLQQRKPWKNTNYSKYISSAIKHPDVSWGNGIVPVWSPAQMAPDHSSLLQYTHPANSTQTFSSRTYCQLYFTWKCLKLDLEAGSRIALQIILERKDSNNSCRKFMGPDRIKNNFSVSTTSLVLY